MATILTNAGHGGSDPGAGNPYNPSRSEKVINLEIDREIARIAASYNHKVHRMRTTDVKAPLDQLVDTANRIGADAVIEIHINSATSTAANGVEVWALPNTSSADFASNMANTIANNASMYNRGFKAAYPDWAPYDRMVRMRNELPGVLHVITESGFITNRNEEAQLSDPQVIAKIAEAHASTINAVLGIPSPAPSAPAVPFRPANINTWLLTLPVVVVGGALVWRRRRI